MRKPDQAFGMRRRGLLLRLGLPRDPAASLHLTGFVVSAVVTVLATRALLGVAGYPRLGAGELHVAHVLWGGLLMAVAFVVLLSFAGPVARPIGALVGGVGFGLFVDEIGKFVTADNDYLYEPAPALIYLTVVVLVLLGEVLHGRVPHHPAERLAAAADHAVAGLAGGFSPRARAAAQAQLDLAGATPGVGEVRHLLAAVDADTTEMPNPIAVVSGAVVSGLARLRGGRWGPALTGGVLLLTLLVIGVAGGLGRGEAPAWVVVGAVASAALAAAGTVLGLAQTRRDRLRGYQTVRWSVLLALLVTQVFLFRLHQWWALGGVVVLLTVLGIVAAEIQDLARRAVPPPAVRGGREAVR